MQRFTVLCSIIVRLVVLHYRPGWNSPAGGMLDYAHGTGNPLAELDQIWASPGEGSESMEKFLSGLIYAAVAAALCHFISPTVGVAALAFMVGVLAERIPLRPELGQGQ